MIGSDCVVVVGASRAGLAAVEGLRDAHHRGRIVLVGAEDWLPYDRTALSKQVLLHDAGGAHERIALATPDSLDGVELWLGTRAVALDLQAREIALDDGRTLGFDALVIATGATPRRPAGFPDLKGVHVLRQLSDALRLRADLAIARHAVVVGGGFIGCEVAASARTLGLQVALVEAGPAPLAQALGREVGTGFAAVHRAHGVEVKCDVTLAGLDGDGRRVTGVRLSDGCRLPADVVVFGIGVQPEVQWLEGSGLELADGLLCDPFLAAAPGIYAAGDLVRWSHPLLGRSIRVEHWTNAHDQGLAAAHNLLASKGRRTQYSAVPYVWSDQYDVRTQLYGDTRDADEIRVISGSVEEQRFVALYGRRGRLVAVLGTRAARELVRYRGMLDTRTSFAAAVVSAVR